MATVTLKDVRKSYGAVNIIQGVDLAIKDREFVVFVGPSGCGKSTLLRMIAGLEEITGGDLSIDGTRRQRRAALERAASPWCSNPTRSTRICRWPTTWRSRCASPACPRPNAMPR